MAESINALFDEAFLADIQHGYRALSARARVHELVSTEGAPVWLVMGYDEVKSALGDSRLSLDRRNAGSSVRGVFPSQMNATLLNRDPPDHTRLRRLVNQAFTARRVELLRPAIERTVEELLAAVSSAPTFDFIEAIAAPLPIRVISDLLGVPVSQTMRFRELAASLFLQVGPISPAESGPALFELVQDLLRAKRDAPSDDLLSALISARDDEDKLDEQELISTTLLILFAGFETTVNLLSTGMLTLLRHDEQLQRLRQQPALVSHAVEELLRYCGPAQLAIRRFALEDMEIAGVTIPRGGIVVLCLAGANLDEGRYPRANDFDLDREDVAHLAFGHGLHFCVGAPLARMEASLVFAALLRQFPQLELAISAEEVPWRPWSPLTSLRGPSSLPVRVQTR